MSRYLALVLLMITTATANAALKPEEVAVLAAASSPQGRELAEYYAQARGIPKSQICLVDVKPGADLERSVWEEQMRPAIRDWLRNQGLETKVRCLVVAWDLPLRVGPRPKSDPTSVARKENLDRARSARVTRFAELLRSVGALGDAKGQADPPSLDSKIAAMELVKKLDAALREAQSRVQKLEGSSRKEAEASLEKAFLVGVGSAGLLQLVERQKEKIAIPEAVGRQLGRIRGNLASLDKELAGKLLQPESAGRDDAILERVDQIQGLLGSLRWIDEQQRLLEKNESQASFDSELALVLWRDYSPLMWQPNPLCYTTPPMTERSPVFMVARLAAPSPELVKKMIDTSIAIEKVGLEGKVYLDARGIAFDRSRDKFGGYALHDQSIRELAERLRKHTKLEVVLDDKPELFQPGQCPDASLYCGWYSLGKYVDAFRWKPGAVAYHIASSEAVDLFKKGSTLWCPAMLERGVAATLGPTFEPYLAAFPLPDDFFPLLLTGRYTVAEVYYRTAPFLSWAMVLVGDPLYNPFKNHPAMDASNLPDRLKTDGKP